MLIVSQNKAMIYTKCSNFGMTIAEREREREYNNLTKIFLITSLVNPIVFRYGFFML